MSHFLKKKLATMKTDSLLLSTVWLIFRIVTMILSHQWGIIGKTAGGMLLSST